MKQVITKWPFLITVVAALVVAQPVSAQFSIVDLGTLGRDYSYASGINARVQVVGWRRAKTWNLYHHCRIF